MKHQTNIEDNKQDDPDWDKPLYVMTLEWGEGNTQHIDVYSDSIPGEWAFEFCKANNLDFSLMNNLTNEIKSFLEKVDGDIGKGDTMNKEEECDPEEINDDHKNHRDKEDYSYNTNKKNQIAKCDYNCEEDADDESINNIGIKGTSNVNAKKERDVLPNARKEKKKEGIDKEALCGEKKNNVHVKKSINSDLIDWTKSNEYDTVSRVECNSQKNTINFSTTLNHRNTNISKAWARQHKPNSSRKQDSSQKLFPYQFYIQQVIEKPKSKHIKCKSTVSSIVVPQGNMSKIVNREGEGLSQSPGKTITRFNTSDRNRSNKSIYDILYEDAQLRRVSYRRPCHFSSSSSVDKPGSSQYHMSRNINLNISTLYSRISAGSSYDQRYLKTYMMKSPRKKDSNCTFHPDIASKTNPPTIVHDHTISHHYNLSSFSQDKSQTMSNKTSIKMLKSKTEKNPVKWLNNLVSNGSLYHPWNNCWLRKDDLCLEKLREEAFSNLFSEWNNNDSSGVWSSKNINVKNSPTAIVDDLSNIIENVNNNVKIYSKEEFIKEMKQVFETWSFDKRRNIINWYKNIDKNNMKQSISPFNTSENGSLKKWSDKPFFLNTNTRNLSNGKLSGFSSSSLKAKRRNDSGFFSTKNSAKRNFYYIF